MDQKKYFSVFLSRAGRILFTTVFLALPFSPSAALEIPDRSFSDSSTPSAKFPSQGFTFSSCSAKIPVKKNTNPWLRVEKKKARKSPMNPEPGSWVESYYVTPAKKEKAFAIVNQEESVYNSPTTLARLDCKNGLIYFQHVIREPAPTNFYRVFDLLTGAEYQVTEGAVTFSPKGESLLVAGASEQNQRCGQAGSCGVQLKFYNCKARKAQQEACTVEKEFNYQVLSSKGRAFFAAVPVKWQAKAKDLKVTIGGARQSPAKIICTLNPGPNCKPIPAGSISFRAASP